MSDIQNIVRMAVDTARPNDPPVNIIDGQGVRINRGRDYQFQIGIYNIDGWAGSGNGTVASGTIQIRATRTGTAIVDVTSTDVSDIAESSWLDGTGQTLSIVLTAAQTAALTTTSETQYWFSLFITTDEGRVAALSNGYITVVEDGGNAGTTPVSGDPTYLTAAQTIAAIQSATGSHEIRAGLWVIIPSVDSDGMVTWSARLA